MPKGLLAIIEKKKSGSEGMDEHSREEGDEEEESADILGEILDVPTDKMRAFKSALKSYVRSCVEQHMDEEGGGGHEKEY